MKTVKDFKDAGLEFVEGDVRGSLFRRHGDVTMIDSLIVSGNSTCESVLASPMREFAWRINTGEKPAFRGGVEWSRGGDHTAKTLMPELNCNSSVKKWRPLLGDQNKTQEKTKPINKIFGADSAPKLTPPYNAIFTQEMVDNGVLPSVGMECRLGELLVVYILGKTKNFELTGQLAYEIIGGDGERINETGTSSGNFKPLTPPKTDKEKLIEEFKNALHDAFGTHTADDWSSIEDIASDLFDSFLIQPLTVEKP